MALAELGHKGGEWMHALLCCCESDFGRSERRFYDFGVDHSCGRCSPPVAMEAIAADAGLALITGGLGAGAPDCKVSCAISASIRRRIGSQTLSSIVPCSCSRFI